MVTGIRVIPLEKLVLRLYHEQGDLETTDKARTRGYRELQKQFAERASPGQRARWEKAQHDSGFRNEEMRDEDLVGCIIGVKEQDFPMGSSKSARWTEDGIFLVSRPGHEDERMEPVIGGCMRPLARMLVDDDIYHRWSVDGREVIAKLDDFLKQLMGEGAVLSRRNASDVLSTVARGMIRTTEKRHATYGVYPDGDKLVLCEDPLPVKDEQASAWEQVKEHVGRNVTREEVQAYIDLLTHWHPYEVLPSFGAGLAAALTPTLRQAHIFTPHVFNYAPEHDLGKSSVALIASLHLYGIGEVSGEGIGSQYRLAAHLDSIALPLTVDEADKLGEKLLPTVKDSAERWTASERGTKELRMIHYRSRAVLIMTGNTLPTENAAVLKRILTVRFDSSEERERRKKGALVKARLEALNPIGFAAVRGYISAHPSRIGLLKTIEQYAHEIEEERDDWQSAQRPQAWAVIYFGLKIFEEFCQAVGVKWAAPSIETFAEQVVEPVERSTWDSRRTDVERYTDWFDGWCATHKKRVEAGRESYDEIEGKDDIWKEGTIGEHEKTWEGTFHTSAMLDIHNRQARPGERIPTLKELQIQAADAVGIPHNLVFESETGTVKTTKFGSRAKRAAFVPFSYAYRPPKSCDLVTGFEPVPPIDGSRTGHAVTNLCVTTESQVTNGHAESRDFVTNPQDILARPKNTQSHMVTEIPTRACKEKSSPSAVNGKPTGLEERLLLEQADLEERRLMSLSKTLAPFFDGLIGDCAETIRDDFNAKWGAYEIRKFAGRWEPAPSTEIVTKLEDDIEGYQKTFRRIATGRNIRARKSGEGHA